MTLLSRCDLRLKILANPPFFDQFCVRGQAFFPLWPFNCIVEFLINKFLPLFIDVFHHSPPPRPAAGFGPWAFCCPSGFHRKKKKLGTSIVLTFFFYTQEEELGGGWWRFLISENGTLLYGSSIIEMDQPRVRVRVWALQWDLLTNVTQQHLSNWLLTGPGGRAGVVWVHFGNVVWVWHKQWTKVRDTLGGAGCDDFRWKSLTIITLYISVITLLFWCLPGMVKSVKVIGSEIVIRN